MAFDPKTFDVRILERKLRRRLISRKEYEKYLQALPDRSDNASSARLDRQSEADEDDEDEDEVAAS